MWEVEKESWVDEETRSHKQRVVVTSIVREAQPQSLFIDVAEQQWIVRVQSVEFRVINTYKD